MGRRSLASRLSQYPKIGRVSKRKRSKADARVFPGKCQQCGSPVPIGSSMVLVDIQVDFMRGNDEVGMCCPECGKKPDMQTLLRACGG